MTSVGRINASLLTDQGRVRDHNEDFIAFRKPANTGELARNGWLYIVADGVGGADAGEVASKFATEQTIHNYLADGETADWGERLYNAMQTANTELRQLVTEQSTTGNRMATTMVAVILHSNKATFANVGDSRGYHWKEGTFQQITKDQSLVARLLEEGAITEEEAVNHPRRNVILHSLGSESTPLIDIYEIELEVGEQLVLCSDGLTRHVVDEEISQIIGEMAPTDATETLIQLANERGGEDNISVIVLKVEELPPDLPRDGEKKTNRLKTVNVTPVDSRTKRALWIYTAVLCLIQTILIILIWFWIAV
ncbi:MAG: Stp1/IreP family PP2C-type Ser/Thr phosphatase [Candidatus Promineifilaceae bacterium]